MNRFISVYFAVLAIVFIFSLCFFIPAFSNQGIISTYTINSNPYAFNLSGNFVWPTPRF